jgi:hypothetical protein
MGGACGTHGEIRGAYNILVGRPERRKDLGVDGRTTLTEILGKHGVEMWIGFIWLRMGTGSCEHSNEPSDSIKCGGLLD